MRRLRPANPAIGIAIAAIAAVAHAGLEQAEAPPATAPEASTADDSTAPAATGTLRRDLPESRPKPDPASASGEERPATLREALASIGRREQPIESGGIVLFDPRCVEGADPATRRLAASAAVRLSTMLAAMRRTLGGFEGLDPPSPPRVVVLHETRDGFELAEATLFTQAPLPSRLATTQELAVGDAWVPLIDAWRDPDEATFRAAIGRAIAMSLLREQFAVSGERSLPAWIREGLASQLVAMHTSPPSLEPVLRRNGLAFIRGGGAIATLLAKAPDDPDWIDLNGPAQAVAFLAVQRLAEGNPTGLDRFLAAVRSGMEVKTAFERAFGTSAEAFIAHLATYYRVND